MAAWENDPVVGEQPAWAKDPVVGGAAWENDPVVDDKPWYTSDKSIPEQTTDMLRAVPTSIGKLTSTVEKGLGQLGATAQEMFGFQDAADAQRRKAQADYEANLKRTEQRFGKVSTPAGEVVEGVGQGLGMVGAMAVNPVLGAGVLAPYVMGSTTDVMDQLNEKGATPEQTVGVAQRIAAGNAILGLIPGAGPVRGALVNWATGQISDGMAYDFLVKSGRKDLADIVLGKRGVLDKQSIIDLIVGGVGGKFEAKGKPSELASDVKNNLDNLDKTKEETQRTQGEGTLYVGPDGRTTDSLPTKIQEDQGQLDLARTELQNNLQREATAREEPVQGDLFPLEPEQQNLDLVTRPNEPEDVANAAPSRTDTPEFKEWFGNSKVRDERGQPLPMYHGTKSDLQNELFSSFNRGDSGKLGAGIYFTPDPDLASRYSYGLNESESKRTILPVFLKLEKPLELTETGKMLPVIIDKLNSLGANLPDDLDVKSISNKLTGKKVTEAARALGFDGVILRDPQTNKVKEMMVFDPEQVKSVYNKGTWRKDTDNISAAPTKYSDTAMGGPRFKETDIQTYRTRDGRVSTSPEAIIKWAISKVDAKDDLSLILPKIQEMLSQFQGGHGVTIELLKTNRTKLDNVPAYYSGNEHKIYLGQDAMTARVAAHEIVHGVTHRFIEASPNHPAVKQLQVILDALKTDESTKNQYGTTDLHELVAEGFSSRVFKDKLMKIGTDLKSGNFQNAWDMFVDSVAQILGVKTPYERTALAKVLESTAEISKAYSKQKIEIDKKYMELFKKSELPIQKSRMAEKIAKELGLPVEDVSVRSPAIKDADTVKADTLKSLTGEEWIPRDPEVTPELLDKISKEADGSNVWALTPGALARSELANSTLVKTIYRLMDNAYKRADLFATRVVAPVEKTFSKILNNDQYAKISHDLIMRELGNGKEYTADELRAAGVPDKVVMAHLEFRAMMQQALEIQNKVLRDKGLPPVRPIDAYMSARWSGPWRANIRDSEGKIIWQIAEQSRGAAKAAMDYIKSKEPNLVFEDVKFKQGRDRGDRVEAGYLDMLKLLDKEDPRIQTLQSIYEDYILGKTENVTAQEKHFLRKTGVKGFAGSRPWSKTDAKDMLVQQFQYAKNAARWAETQLPMEKVNTLLNDPKLQESQKNNIAFSKEYTKGQLGFGTKSVFEAIDNSLAKAFGTSPQKLQEYMGAAKTVFYLKTLGLSIPFTITQFLQPAITTPGWHSKLSGDGFKHNPVLTTLNSIAKGGAGASWHYARVMGNEGQMKLAEKMLNDVELDAVKYMEANSVVEINPLSDIKRNLRPSGVKAVAAPFEFTIRHSELIARSMAFMGYVSHLQQSGRYDTSTKEGRMKLFQQAEDMTKISMTDYRPQERALLFERGGLTGDAAATLHSYQINNLAQLTKFSKMALDGNPKPLVMMIGMQAMAAGLTGLWFVEDLDDLWENLKKLLPHDEYLKVKDISIKNYILDNFGELGAYGLVSSLTGTNIHTRMNASDQIPVWPFEPQLNMESLTDLAPFIESTAAIGAAGIALANPNATEQEKMAAFYKAAPAGAQGPMENLPAFNEGATSLNTKDLTLGEYRRTPEEKNLRNFGFRSPEEQKFKDKKWTLSKVEQQLQTRLSTAGKKATQFVISGDMAKANAEIQKYQELGGDVETLVQGLSKAQLNRLTVELERRALTAESGSLPAVMKLKRYVDIYGDKTNR